MKTSVTLIMFTAFVSMLACDALAQRPGPRQAEANGRPPFNQNANERQQFNQNANNRQQFNQNENGTATMARNLLQNFDADGSSSLDAEELQLALNALQRMMSQNQSQTNRNDGSIGNARGRLDGQRDQTDSDSTSQRRGQRPPPRQNQTGNQANRSSPRQRGR